MAIGTIYRNDYVGDDSTGTYTYGFKIFAASDLKVIVTDSNGGETPLTLGANYTVTGVGLAAGGTIVLQGSSAHLDSSGRLKTGYKLSIERNRPFSQATDLRNQSAFFPDVHEDALDHATMLAQRAYSLALRAMRLQEGLNLGGYGLELPYPDASKVLGWNATGDTIVNHAVGVATPSSIDSVDVPFLQAGSGAVSRSARAELRETVKATQFGALGTGSDDSPKIQDAIDYVSSIGGGRVLLPRPSAYYGIDADLVIPDNVILEGESRYVELRALQTNLKIVHVIGSYGGVRLLTINGDNRAGTSALRISPEDETQTTTLVAQNFGWFGDLLIKNCDEGIVQRTGPDVGSVDSGCFFNTCWNIHILDCIRGVWLVEHPSDSGAAGVNRGQFYSVRIGSNGSRANTGFHIACGATNSFFGCSTEGIQNGSTPSATPTAVAIEGRGAVNLADNNENRFFGFTDEASTRQIDIKTSNANNNAFIGGAGIQIAKVVNNGTSSVLDFPAASLSKGVWWDYSSTDAIPLLGISGFGVRIRDWLGVDEVRERTTGAGITADGALVKDGGIQLKRQVAGVAATAMTNPDLGGVRTVTGPGGGAVTQDFNFPFANDNAIYLAIATGVSQSTSTSRATRVSYFTEHASGTFVEHNVVDSKNTISTSTLGLSRSSDTVTLTVTMSGGVGSEIIEVKYNLLRVA